MSREPQRNYIQTPLALFQYAASAQIACLEIACEHFSVRNRDLLHELGNDQSTTSSSRILSLHAQIQKLRINADEDIWISLDA
jgi:hypothetical protein